MKRRRLSVLVLCLLLVFALVNPLAAKISRASSRVIQEPDDLITTRKANFKLGDILGVPLVSMTITNNAEVGYLLLSLELTIDAASGSLTTDDKLVAVIVRKFESNEVFKFTNEDLLDYIGDIRRDDTSIDQDMLDAFGMSSLSMDSLDSYLKSGKRLPEGVYTMTLTASDITPDDPDNLTTTTYTTGTTYTSDSVEFKVITIGSLNITQVPTVYDKTLAFEVPEIPYYSDTSIPTASTTRVTITGPSIIRPITLSRDHTRVTSSAGSTLKGYPGDLEDGIDTFDLSGVNFRAGERYDFEIDFIDSSGYSIADLTTEISFPEPRFSAEVDRTRPFKPEFSWGFNDDYSGWAKEYRVYLNDRYVGYTSGNTYTVSSSLNPSTYYSWHVMPVNRDGSAFFEEAPRSAEGSFTTQAHTSLEIEVSSPSDNATLIAGNTYAFSATPTLSDDAKLEKVTWMLPEGLRFGIDISYTPTRRFPEGSLRLYTIAEDSFHLKKSSTRVNLTVLDPAIAISGVNTIPAEVPVTFTLDSAATHDLDRVEWFKGASSIGTGASHTYTFKESGTYSITARGTTRPDMDGVTKTVTSAAHMVEVTDITDDILVIAGDDEREVFRGVPVMFSLAASESYDPSIVEWFAEGTLIGTGKTISYAFKENGTYSVTASIVAADAKQLISRPQIVKVTSPPDAVIISGGALREVEKGEAVTFALDPTGTHDLDRVEWFANGTLIGTGKTISYAFKENGTYSVTAVITSASGRAVVSRHQVVTVVDSDTVLTISGGASSNILQGETVTFRIEPSSAYVLSEKSITWYVDGTPAGAGTTFFYHTFDGNFGTYSITAKATTMLDRNSSARTLSSRPLVVTVVDPDTVLTISGGESIHVGRGDSVTFHLESSVIPELTGYSYTWYENTNPIGSSSSTSFSYTFNESGTYYISAKGSRGRVPTVTSQPQTVTSQPQTVTVTDMQHGPEQAGPENLFGVGESINTEVPPMFPPDFGMNGGPPDFVVTETMRTFHVGPDGTIR
ncbi:MAG: hypothetical protein JXK93_13110 [Sphaerochaetaceae bacterium]|nr:hypothetical protein [Sphaerochaetaceae bacterium]